MVLATYNHGEVVYKAIKELKIAKTDSEKICVPSWTEIRQMVQNSQPKIIYKYLANAGLNQDFEAVMTHDLKNSDHYMNEMECVTNTKRIRKDYHSMIFFTPKKVAMRGSTSEADTTRKVDVIKWEIY